MTEKIVNSNETADLIKESTYTPNLPSPATLFLVNNFRIVCLRPTAKQHLWQLLLFKTFLWRYNFCSDSEHLQNMSETTKNQSESLKRGQ
jgi:hypothetical protein